MAEFRWVREQVTPPQGREETYGRQIGELMGRMVGGGWEPVTAVPHPGFSDTVLVLMRKG